MKKKGLAALLLLCAFCLTGCARYTSGYSAMGLIHANIGNTASMDFYQFSGKMVFTLTCEDPAKEAIRYTGRLECGSATVWYDCGDGKVKLFSIVPGKEADDLGGQLAKGTVYIIVETKEKCQNGSFHFGIEAL